MQRRLMRLCCILVAGQKKIMIDVLIGSTKNSSSFSVSIAWNPFLLLLWLVHLLHLQAIVQPWAGPLPFSPSAKHSSTAESTEAPAFISLTALDLDFGSHLLYSSGPPLPCPAGPPPASESILLTISRFGI